ncbi:hypothetical protein INR49_017729 [Caranx melampygus]|nr:hypothetical protein INR49_017729 [Caranx melampygus]
MKDLQSVQGGPHEHAESQHPDLDRSWGHSDRSEPEKPSCLRSDTIQPSRLRLLEREPDLKSLKRQEPEQVENRRPDLELHAPVRLETSRGDNTEGGENKKQSIQKPIIKPNQKQVQSTDTEPAPPRKPDEYSNGALPAPQEVPLGLAVRLDKSLVEEWRF